MARAKQTIIDEIKQLSGQDLNAADYTAEQLEEILSKIKEDAASGGAAVTNDQFGEADDKGNRWKTEPVGKQVRVHVLSKSGRSFNALFDSEDKGKTFLTEYARKNP